MRITYFLYQGSVIVRISIDIIIPNKASDVIYAFHISYSIRILGSYSSKFKITRILISRITNQTTNTVACSSHISFRMGACYCASGVSSQATNIACATDFASFVIRRVYRRTLSDQSTDIVACSRHGSFRMGTCYRAISVAHKTSDIG